MPLPTLEEALRPCPAVRPPDVAVIVEPVDGDRARLVVRVTVGSTADAELMSATGWLLESPGLNRALARPPTHHTFWRMIRRDGLHEDVDEDATIG